MRWMPMSHPAHNYGYKQTRKRREESKPGNHNKTIPAHELKHSPIPYPGCLLHKAPYTTNVLPVTLLNSSSTCNHTFRTISCSSLITRNISSVFALRPSPS